jgi:hypothetical protein
MLAINVIFSSVLLVWNKHFSIQEKIMVTHDCDTKNCQGKLVTWCFYFEKIDNFFYVNICVQNVATIRTCKTQDLYTKNQHNNNFQSQMLLKKIKLCAIKSKARGESNLNPFEFGPLYLKLSLYK